MKTNTQSFVIGSIVGSVACAVIAMILGAGAPQAQPSQPAPQAQQAPRAPLQAIAPAGADDAKALALLTQLVGSWAVQGTSIAADGTTSGPFQGTTQFGWTLGGNFLSGDHVLFNSSGSALQTIDVMGFTPGVGFTRSEITNGDRSMFLSTGIYDDAASALTFVTSNTLLTADGQPRSLATTFLFQPDGSIVWNTMFQVGDQPAGTVKLVLTQTSKTPGLSNPQTPFGAPMLAQQGGVSQSGAPAAAGGSFIVQTPQGLAVTRPPQTAAENQQLLSAMMQQRQQMQAQMNTMQGQVPDMSRSMSGGWGQ
ncbi:MAG: DUF1579 domain-containing protein [Phycisphaerales bacterium]|nr:DUF1579 domain-containing protein [Phycisphaerales bacterium]